MAVQALAHSPGKGSLARRTILLAIGVLLVLAPAAGADTLKVYDDRVELQGDAGGEQYVVTSSPNGGGKFVVYSQDGNTITPGSDKCEPIRIRNSGHGRQSNVAACPKRDRIVIKAGGGSDSVRFEPGFPVPATIDGEEGDDNEYGGLQGTEHDDTIRGREGADAINGRDGNDKCYGGPETIPKPDTIEQCEYDLSVRWDLDDRAEPIDSNPNAGGGLRVFPDRLFPGDQVARERIAVTVKIDPPDDDHEIDLRTFDVDDPSSNAAPIDSNGARGLDNRVAAPVIPPAGQLTEQTVQTDTNGEGHTLLNLAGTIQPGNNFRVAASERPQDLGSMTQAQADALTPPANVAVSEMLTVWRKLYVEVDTMAAPGGANTVSGRVLSTQPLGTSDCRVTTDKTLEQANQYEKSPGDPLGRGDLLVAPRALAVIDNSAGPNSYVDVHAGSGAGRCPSIGSDFLLHDDDDDSLLPGVPNTSLLGSPKEPEQNRLAPAYIRPELVPDASDQVPFDVNVEPEDQATLSKPVYSKWDSRGSSNPIYWSTYLIRAFQGLHQRDGDPNDETPLRYGEGLNAPVTFVYPETMADACGRSEPNRSAFEAKIVLHELGHQLAFDANHRDGGIMGLSECSLAANDLQFTAPSIARIRSLKSPAVP